MSEMPDINDQADDGVIDVQPAVALPETIAQRVANDSPDPAPAALPGVEAAQPATQTRIVTLRIPLSKLADGGEHEIHLSQALRGGLSKTALTKSDPARIMSRILAVSVLPESHVLGAAKHMRDPIIMRFVAPQRTSGAVPQFTHQRGVDYDAAIFHGKHPPSIHEKDIHFFDENMKYDRSAIASRARTRQALESAIADTEADEAILSHTNDIFEDWRGSQIYKEQEIQNTQFIAMRVAQIASGHAEFDALDTVEKQTLIAQQSDALTGILAGLTTSEHNRVGVPRALLEAHMSLANERIPHEPGVPPSELKMALTHIGDRIPQAHGAELGNLFLSLKIQGYPHAAVSSSSK